MLSMGKLTEHYRQLLGLDASWEVSDVSLCLEEKRVEITLVHRGGPVTCPDCDTECVIADHSPERSNRHRSSDTTPIRCLISIEFSIRSRSKIRAEPVLGRKSPVSILIVVDFPAPFGPRNP